MGCGRTYRADKESCPFCGASVKRAKRMIKEKSGKLVLVTPEEIQEREAEELEKQRHKAEYHRRKKSC